MRTAIAVIFALAAMVVGQTPEAQPRERVFYITQTETAQQFQEMATAIRTIAQIREVTADNAQRSVAVRGTADQIALAEWLFNELDRPADGQPGASREYRITGAGDDFVRVFYVTSAKTVQEFQEVATLIRTIADIRTVFTYNPVRGLMIRGTADQGALAEWLFNELNDALRRRPESAPEYRAAGGRDEVIRVFYFPQTFSIQEFQEAATLIRTITNITRVFTYNEARAMALRGTSSQVQMAEWLHRELNGTAQGPQSPPVHEYRIPGAEDDVVSVLYLPNAATVQRFQEIATQIRAGTGLGRVFTFNKTRAFAVRGTSNQTARAAQLAKELDTPGASAGAR